MPKPTYNVSIDVNNTPKINAQRIKYPSRNLHIKQSIAKYVPPGSFSQNYQKCQGF